MDVLGRLAHRTPQAYLPFGANPHAEIRNATSLQAGFLLATLNSGCLGKNLYSVQAPCEIALLKGMQCSSDKAKEAAVKQAVLSPISGAFADLADL